MKIKSVNSMACPAPLGGYSQAILLQGTIKLLFISGQIPESKDGIVPNDFESQCRLVWSNVIAQLEAAEMTIANIAKVTIFLSKRKYADINGVIRKEITR